MLNTFLVSMLTGEGTSTTTGLTGIDWSSVISADMFQPLITGITDILPTVIAVCIPLIVIRKGWDFLKGNIYSA